MDAGFSQKTDTSLISPPILTSDLPSFEPSLIYKGVLWSSWSSVVSVDIRKDEEEWSTIYNWPTSTFIPELLTLPLSSWASGSNSFQLRWRYTVPVF